MYICMYVCIYIYIYIYIYKTIVKDQYITWIYISIFNLFIILI